MPTEFWQTVKEWICKRIGHKLTNIQVNVATRGFFGWCKRCGFYQNVNKKP